MKRSGAEIEKGAYLSGGGVNEVRVAVGREVRIRLGLKKARESGYEE